MANLEFSLTLSSNPNELITHSMDYESYVNYLPDHIKNITIIEKTHEETITEEVLEFHTIITKKIIQRSSHKKKDNVLFTEIISGPFKNSKIEVKYDKHDSGTIITLIGNLEIPLKYKILSIAIKKMYKIVLRGILYKINNEIIKSKKETVLD
jgi:ribosome-associated toxin RatA of RatAB toxin-antitoxin module